MRLFKNSLQTTGHLLGYGRFEMRLKPSINQHVWQVKVFDQFGSRLPFGFNCNNLASGEEILAHVLHVGRGSRYEIMGDYCGSFVCTLYIFPCTAIIVQGSLITPLI